MRITCILLLLGAFALSCANVGNRARLVTYYDLDTIISEQIIALQETQPGLVKKVALDGQEDRMTLDGPEVDWKRELEIFKESDINVPALVGAFTVHEGVDETRYIRKDSTSSGVRQFQVYYFKNSDLPRRIVVANGSANSLYTSERQFELHFEMQNDQCLLSSFRVEGKQSILNQEPTTYLMEAELVR